MHMSTSHPYLPTTPQTKKKREYGGREWEGDKDGIAHSDNKYLNDFIFSSELYKKIKNVL